ncbi:MAG: hypothetical protein AAGA66_04270 [Bacteroidota bacterium]
MMRLSKKSRVRPFGLVAVGVTTFSLVLCRCASHQEFSDPETLATYLASRDRYHQEVRTGATTLSVTYRPTDLILAKEVHEQTTAGELAQMRQHYENYLYFQLSLQHNDRAWLTAQVINPSYGELVRTLSFRMSEHLRLITPSDTLLPVSTYHDRMYGLANATELLVAFPRDGIREKERVRLVVNEFGGRLGQHAFPFASTDLLNEPNIQFTTR